MTGGQEGIEWKGFDRLRVEERICYKKGKERKGQGMEGKDNRRKKRELKKSECRKKNNLDVDLLFNPDGG